MPRVSVVSPFLNEEAILENAVKRMAGSLVKAFGNAWELILVDDGSSDGSLPQIEAATEQLQNHSDRIRVIGFPYNQGRGRALKAGIDVARSPIIATTEVDCSWGDDIVERMVDVLDADPRIDFVVASPHRKGGSFFNVPRHRVWLSFLGNKLIRVFFDSGVTMNTGMTRAYRAHVIKPLVTVQDGKEFHLEVLLKLLTIGFRHAEVPARLEWQDRHLAKAGTAAKRKSSTRLLRTIGTHMQFLAIAQPVRYFGAVAAVCVLISAAFLVAALYQLLIGSLPAAFLAIVGLLSGILALLFMGFAVLFAQMRQMMRESWMKAYPSPLPPTAAAAEERRHASRKAS